MLEDLVFSYLNMLSETTLLGGYNLSMWWERAALLLAALPERTDMQRVFCGFLFFFFFFTVLVLSFTKLVQGDLLLATGTEEDWPGAFLQKMRQGVPNLKVPQFGRQEMLLPGYCSVTLGCIPSPLPACPPLSQDRALVWKSSRAGAGCHSAQLLAQQNALFQQDGAAVCIRN